MVTLKNVQALRFFAAFGVMLFHARPFLPGEEGELTWLAPFALLGFAGVDVFFVISGFILWHTTRHPLGIKSAGIFIVRRYWRIFSGYWPFCLLAVAVFAALEPAVLAQKAIISSLLLVPLTPLNELLIPVSWTLRYELYFYTCLTLLLLLPAAVGRTAVWVVAGVVLCSTMYFVFVLGVFSPENWSHASVLPKFYLSPLCLEFIGGVLLAQHYERLQGRLRLRYVAFAILALFLTGYLYQLHGNLNVPGMIGAYHYPERVFFFGSAAVLLLYLLLECERRSILAAPRGLVLLGDASYALYLAHPLAFFALGHTLRTKGWLLGPGQLVLIMCAVILYAVIHYLVIERPLYREGIGWIPRLRLWRMSLAR